LRVQAKTLQEAGYPDASFDVVTLWDVLEHLPDPVETLGDVARILEHKGVLALTTINHNCINERLLKERWRYYMPPDHLCSFTPALLRSVLDRSGFTVVKLRHQYMFEVLLDVYLPFLISPKSLPRVLYKMKKLLYLVLNQTSQAMFNALHSGDLITVYARKN
jgi:ubiquinone/menaquinone biosynthesis C-methylase UbiE